MRLNGEYRRREWVVVFRVRGLAFGIRWGANLNPKPRKTSAMGYEHA